MSNQDQFDAAIAASNFVEAARLAIQFGSHKGSRNGAWNWANDAIEAAQKAGITLNPGRLSWPDFRAMEQQLEARK